MAIACAPLPSRLSLHAPVALWSAVLPTLAVAESSPGQDLGGSVFQLLFGLLAVLALLFASLWLLKRLSAPRGAAAGLMRVIAGTAVGARERVVVLEVGSTWLVLGVAPGRVTALAELPRGNVPADPGPTEDFASRLRHRIGGRDAR